MRDPVTEGRLGALRTPIVVPRFTRSILVRSLALWAFARVLAGVAMANAAGDLGAPEVDPVRLRPGAALLLITAVGVVGWVAARRRNEDLFLLCLGYGRGWQLATILAPPVLLEVGIAVLIATP
jgi:hypothetical protein